MSTFVDEVAATFGLGQPRHSSAVPGGLSNDLLRVETSGGAFAVKVMRANARDPEFRANIETAFAIETRARRGDVPCPEPVTFGDGHCLAEVSGELVRVHHWIDGEKVDGSQWVSSAGSLIAQIHGVAEPFMAPLEDEPWDSEGWASLADHPEMPIDLARGLRDAAPALARLEEMTAAPGLDALHVNTHGDLDPKNTLATEGGLLALDWDAAGPQPLCRDAATVALDWGISPHGFSRVLAAYAGLGGRPVPAEPWVLGGWVSALGGWLVFNATTRPADALGQREIQSTCARLLNFDARLDEYLSALLSV